jgi:hypothetical protein
MRPPIWAVLLCAISTGCGTPAPPPTTTAPLWNAFAHNDYAHQRPLLDALDHGFGGVEADVFLVDGELLVAHAKEELRPDRTLQSLYLDPLKKRIAENAGQVYRGRPGFTLMIDVKTDAKPTYTALRKALEPYRAMLTTWKDDRTAPGPVTIVLSGNRARQTITAEPERLLAIDGRLEDLEAPSPAPPTLIPWISAPWPRTFQWTGEGPIPEPEKEKLRALVQKSHAQGRQIRFWATPERLQVWRELREAGVDLINTDDLAGLSRFLTSPGN